MFLKTLITIFFAQIFFGCNSNENNQIVSGNEFIPPYFIDVSSLESISEKINNKEEPFLTFGLNLFIEADEWLDSSYATIVNKNHFPTSNNKHDYYSIGPYWWPDPTKEDGKPYIRKDGFKNPESFEYDRPKLMKMIEAIKSLTLAYSISNEDKYKNKAIGFLETWFLNDETKMNPHLEYGQAIPGITDGRGIGIIETHRLTDVVDAIGLLYRKNVIDDLKYKKYQQWFEEYNIWLTTSKKGIDEKNWHNNHGSSYDLQVISFSLFTNNRITAKATLDSLSIRRIITQIEPDGSQPFELKRTRAFHYSIYNLQFLVKSAFLGEMLNYNLWEFVSEDGRSIYNAINFLIPYLFENKSWDYPRMISSEHLKTEFFTILNLSNNKTPNLKFNKYLEMYDLNNHTIQKEILKRPKNLFKEVF